MIIDKCITLKSSVFLILLIATFLPACPLQGQVFYTVDFAGDQASWNSSGDCGIIHSLWNSYSSGESVIDIQSNEMTFIDLEGGGCPALCSGQPGWGGDLQNFYQTVPFDISGRCQVMFNVDFSLINDTSIPTTPGDKLECNPGCGEDWLSFEYSLDGGSYNYFDPSETNQFCENRNIIGNSYSISSELFIGSTVELRMQVGSQSVVEGIRIDQIELEEIPSPMTVNAGTVNTTVCEGQDIILDETGSGGTSWNWTGPNGFVGPTQNTTVTGADLPGIGSHDYTVVVTDSNNCTDTDVVALSVVSGFTATLLGGGDLCPDSCTESGEHMEVGLSGGAEPYTVTFSVNGFTIPFPFGFNIGDNTFQICHESGGIIPSWDTGTNPVQITIPDAIWQLSGGSISIDIDNIVDDNGCSGTINGGSFDLTLAPKPSAKVPNLDPICFDETTGYDLTQWDTAILDGGGGDVIWLDDNADITSTISNPTAYNLASNNPVWAVVFDDPCYSDIIELDFDINLRPLITPSGISDVVYCGQEVELPDFDVLFNIQNENNPQYFLDQNLTDGPYSAGQIVQLDIGANDLYVYDSSAPDCDAQMAAVVVTEPEPEITFPQGSLSACGTIELPEPIVDNENGMVYEYNTEPDGGGIPYFEGDEFDISSGINLLYLIVTNTGGFIPCIDTAHIQLVYLGGTSYTATIPEQICDTLFLPPIIPASGTVAYYEAIPGGISYMPGDTITFAQTQAGNNPLDTLYVYDPTQVGACATIDTLVFEIGRTPILAVPIQTQFCDQGLLPPQSNNNPNLEYASDRDFVNILNPIFPLTQSTQVFYRDSFAFVGGGACYAQDSFLLSIVDLPYAGRDTAITICEEIIKRYNLYELLGNPDTGGNFDTDLVSNANILDPTEAVFGSQAIGSYYIDYTLAVAGCPTQTKRIDITVVPLAYTGTITTDIVCTSIGTISLPQIFDNPDPGGRWRLFSVELVDTIAFTDPTAIDLSTIPLGEYRITYSIEYPDDESPLCNNLSQNGTFELVNEPNSGVNSELKICQGYSTPINFMGLLGTPDLGGNFTIDGNPVDFKIIDSTNVDVSILGVGTQEVFYSIEQEGCTPSVSTITIEVATPPSLGNAQGDTLCNSQNFIIPTDYIQNNDQLSEITVLNPAGIPVPAAPGLGWALSGPGIYEVVYTVETDPDFECDVIEGRFEVTVLESINAGEDNTIPICRGQEVNMNTLLSTDATLGGTFYQDIFPVFDPTQWIPASQNDTVVVQYILETSSTSCESDTAVITVILSDNLSAGNSADDVYACTGTTILLSDFINNQTPGGQFFLTSDLTTPIDENYTIGITDAEITYIISGAIGCDSDSLDFVVAVVPDSDVNMLLSENELCYDEDDCITVDLSTNIDGLLEFLISGQDPQNIAIIQASTFFGETTLTLCPSPIFNEPAMSSDTFYMGRDPIVQIDLSSISNTAFPCQSNDLNKSESIIIKEDFLITIDTTICPGASIMFDGQAYFTDTDITDTRANGCDSIVTIQISNYNLIDNDIEQDLCEGQAYENIPGFRFTTDIDTTVVLVGLASTGCDSTINLKLTFTDKAVGPLDYKLCFGDSIEVDGVIFNEGFTTDEVASPIASTFGCDSATLVTVEFYDEVALIDEARTICPEETYPLGDQIFGINNTSGIAVLAGEAIGGCDSLVNVILDFHPAQFSFDATICANDSIVIGNETYSTDLTSGISLSSEQTINGCDSVVSVNITITDLEERVFDPMLCEDQDFAFNGRVYNFSNPFGIEYLENQSGCDTMLTIDIASLQSSVTNLDIELCSDIDTLINGETYNASNLMGEAVLQNAAGCDSSVVVTVAISTPSVDYFTEYCPGESEGTIVITDLAGLSLPATISFEGILTPLTINELPFGTGGIETGRIYTLILDDGACVLEEEVTIDSSTQPSLTITSSELATNSFQLSISSDLTVTGYEWTPAQILDCTDCENPIATIEQEETVLLTITSDQGCSYQTSITLTPEEQPTNIDSTGMIFLPNSLSIEDPLNSTFFIMSETDFMLDELSIYDRWGNLVFTNQDFMTNDESSGWNGRRNDKVEQGVYVYVLSYSDPQLGDQVVYGSITVIR